MANCVFNNMRRTFESREIKNYLKVRITKQCWSLKNKQVVRKCKLGAGYVEIQKNMSISRKQKQEIKVVLQKIRSQHDILKKTEKEATGDMSTKVIDILSKTIIVGTK